MSRSTLRADLDAAVLALAFAEARVEAYTRFPALDRDGGPLPLPMRRRIALRTARKREAIARAAYVARYPQSAIAQRESELV